jgi:hypothetical protein
MRFFIQLSFCFTIGVLFTACKKDVSTTSPVTADPVITVPSDTTRGDLVLNFQAMANGSVLVPNTYSYTNVAEDTFTVTKFNYYISNVKLKRSDGQLFAEKESYHLIKHVEGQTSFTITDVPPGDYGYIEFLIGVDSLRNVSGVQSGALDVANGMFWDWNSGYIFFKLEGSYKDAVEVNGHDYSIHIGGFKGQYSCLQKPAFNLIQSIKISGKRKSKLYYNVSVDEIFTKPRVFSFDQYFGNPGDKTFWEMSKNYMDMFAVDKIEN